MIEKKAGDQTTFGGFQTGFDLGKRDQLDFRGTWARNPLDFIDLGE